MRKYHRLTYEERLRIESLFRAGVPKKIIAQNLGFSLTTIYNELAKGRYMRRDKNTYLDYVSYSADVAQKRVDYNSTARGRDLKIANDFKFVRFVEHYIIDLKYSPEAVLLELEKRGFPFSTRVCVKTLYNYIDMGIFPNLTNKHLPVKSSRKPRQYRPLVRASNFKAGYPSISERSDVINSRQEPGHWEMDTVYGKRQPNMSCLLVLTERVTRLEIIMKMNSMTALEVKRCLDRLELVTEDFSQRFKSITMDNGREFHPSYIEMSCRHPGQRRTKIYFCHPYSSFERGSNENANRLIRRHLPKGTALESLSDDDVLYIQNWMNNYPRRLFNGLSSNEIYASLQESS